MKQQEFEIVVGLEVHAELKTQSKIFCACPTAFGAPPNSNCCPVCIGLPGAMPTLNRRVVELAVMAGAALHCQVARVSRIDRKQYFYPDLPKAYQISQAEQPICKNGYLEVVTEGKKKRIGIIRIHIEEDAGKLIHKGEESLIDYNRCGVPLIEIVSAPDMRSGAEAAAYLRGLRDVLVSCGISDGKMQEGSLRCDVNVSVRPKGSANYGVRTEIKNINSFAFVEKAVEYEAARQIDLIRRGEAVQAQTLRFDETTGKTRTMRTKEQAIDYRFLIEPDLPPILLTDEEIKELSDALPELPATRAARLEKDYGLTAYDAEVLVGDYGLADYFEDAARHTDYPKLLCNLLLSDLLRVCKSDPFLSPIHSGRLSALTEMLGKGRINSATAKKLLSRLVQSDFDPCEAVERENLAQITDPCLLRKVICEVLLANPRAVSDYKNGKSAALRALQGQLMAKTQGRADPKAAEQLLTEALQQA